MVKMPKTRNRRRFRKAPYAYFDSRLAHWRALCHNSTATSRDTEIGCKTLLLELGKCAPLEGTTTFTKYNELLQDLRILNMNDVKVSAHGSRSSITCTSQVGTSRVGTSTSTTPLPTCQLSTGISVNDNPVPSSVTRRTVGHCRRGMVTTPQHLEVECGDDDDVQVVPELPVTEVDGDAIVPSFNKLSTVAKEKKTNQSETCGLNCRNECHKRLTIGIAYFSDIGMCDECISNIEQACSECQLAYRTKKMISKAKVHHV